MLSIVTTYPMEDKKITQEQKLYVLQQLLKQPELRKFDLDTLDTKFGISKKDIEGSGYTKIAYCSLIDNKYLIVGRVGDTFHGTAFFYKITDQGLEGITSRRIWGGSSREIKDHNLMFHVDDETGVLNAQSYKYSEDGKDRYESAIYSAGKYHPVSLMFDTKGDTGDMITSALIGNSKNDSLVHLIFTQGSKLYFSWHTLRENGAKIYVKDFKEMNKSILLSRLISLGDIQYGCCKNDHEIMFFTGSPFHENFINNSIVLGSHLHIRDYGINGDQTRYVVMADDYSQEVYNNILFYDVKNLSKPIGEVSVSGLFMKSNFTSDGKACVVTTAIAGEGLRSYFIDIEKMRILYSLKHDYGYSISDIETVGNAVLGVRIKYSIDHPAQAELFNLVTGDSRKIGDKIEPSRAVILKNGTIILIGSSKEDDFEIIKTELNF